MFETFRCSKMSRKRPITQDFNSLFGAPINLKKNKEKIATKEQNGKIKPKDKNKENVDLFEKVSFFFEKLQNFCFT